MGIVYKICIENTTNIYIGSTIRFSKRKVEHLRDLKNGNHHCTYLQRHYNKYLPKIVFEILYEGSDYLEKEQYFLDTITNKFNTSKSATAPMLGLNHSKEVRDKMSIRLTLNNPIPKGSKRSEKFCVPIIYNDQYYNSISDLCKEIGAQHSNISRAIYYRKQNMFRGKSIKLVKNG